MGDRGAVNIEYPVMLPIGEVIGCAEGMKQDAFATVSIGHLDVPIPYAHDNAITYIATDTCRIVATGRKVKAWAELKAEIPDRSGLCASYRGSPRTETPRIRSSTPFQRLAPLRMPPGMPSASSWVGAQTDVMGNRRCLPSRLIEATIPRKKRVMEDFMTRLTRQFSIARSPDAPEAGRPRRLAPVHGVCFR